MVYSGQIMNTSPPVPSHDQPEFTLCTYTYNDASLAHGLLKHAAGWPLRPREVIIVDDGSAMPFVLEPGEAEAFGPDAQVRVIRLPNNAGAGVCKAAGLAAASSEYILSLDCDIRLAGAWLPAAFAMVGEPGVGLVGGAVESDAGEDAVSHYLREVDHHLRPEGETDFVSGAAWLLPSAVWAAVGGFGGYTARTHEDHHFCSRVRTAGYKIMACVEASQVLQVRVLSRVDMVRRFRAWLESSLREQSAPYDTIQVSAFQVCKESLRRLEYLLRSSNGDVKLVYLEVLLCLYTLLYMCGFKDNAPSQGAAQGLRLAVGDLLAERPRVRELLCKDLGWSDEAAGGPDATGAAGGMAADSPAPQQVGQWRHFWHMMFEPLRGLFDSPLGQKLEDEGIAALLEEDSRVKVDYSLYKDL